MKKYSTTVYFQIPSSSVPIRKTFSIEAIDEEEATGILKSMVKLYRQRLEGTEKPSEVASKMKSVTQKSEVNERLVRILKGAWKK